MPVHGVVSFRIDPGKPLALDPNRLAANGPILQAAVSLDAKRAQILAQGGTQLPSPKIGSMLIDTGASMTSVERTILTSLGIPPVGDCQVKTPSGGELQQIYPCSIEFPGSPLPVIPNIFVLGANLAEQNIIGLIGRDFLANCLFVFNGPSGAFTISI
jgi:predicted aspartyl protease